ncbi:optineurin-like isoform X2 [Penaeus japonicus]|nr:optineurin-like isoform X2 [Penaeus japonicus]XP_042885082.1 optineurin-like isoform X2 [Penaeus japonicus]
MVRQDEPIMGQGGLCGVTSPGIDSFPPTASPPVASTNANGIASEVQESLTTLLSAEGTVCQDELIAKLRSVVNENLELKETIAQNNLALRQQLALVVKWNQQNEQQQHQHRQQLLEFSQQLSSLQQENATLKAHLAGSKTSEVSSQPRFQELDETIRLLNTRLEFAERNLRQVQEEREKLIALKSRLEGDITLLKCDLTTTRSEQERLQLERFELLSTANELRQQLRQVREGAAVKARSLEASPVNESADNPLGEVEFKKMKDQLRKEQDTSATLLQELHDTRTQVEGLESEVQRAQGETSLYRERCRNLQSKVDATFAHAPAAMDRKEPLDALERKRLMDEAAMLREEVDTLDAALTAERQKTADERTALSKAHSELSRLKKELMDAKERLERETQNDQYYQVKIKSASEKYDEATAKLMSYEELLAAKNDELSRLKKDLGQAKASLAERASEGETIAILRAQVEVYQGDFRAEREAREALATDREKLRDELRHLQTRNTQLVDELEAYQRRHLNQGQGRGSRAASEEPTGGTASGGGGAASVSHGGGALLSPEVLWDKLSNTSDKKEEDKKEEEIDESLFYCPKCNKSFAQYRPLEEHVNRCLDED